MLIIIILNFYLQVSHTIYSEHLGKKCAMKVIMDARACDAEKLIEREIEILGSLNHPNCLQFFGCTYNRMSRLPIIVMQFCNGGCLTDYILENKRPRLSKADKCRIILEIAKGIAYLHSLGFIHRDLKLDNILMHNGHPVIADFGLSRKLDMQCSVQLSRHGTPL